MTGNGWTFWVCLVKDGERCGLLLKRRAKPIAGIEHAYFYIDDGEGLRPNAAIQNLCGSSVHSLTPNRDERRIFTLLKRCAQFAEEHGGCAKIIPLGEVYDTAKGDYSHEIPKLFDVARSFGNANSKLRKFLVDEKVFAVSVLSKRRGNVLSGYAQEFNTVSPQNVQELHDDIELHKRVHQHIQKEAVRELKKQLRSDDLDDYVELKLEIGRLPRPGEDSPLREDQPASPLEFGRTWSPFNEDTLLIARRQYFLNSISGAGKSTFVRHIQQRLCDDDDILPFYLRAQDLPKESPLTWPDVRGQLAKSFCEVATGQAVDAFLDEQFNSNRIVFLIDGMDQLGKRGMNCSELVTQVISMSKGNTVIMTGRPSAARWVEDRSDLVFLRLEPFDKAAREKFFGDTYGRALELCRSDMGFLSVPMQAYLVRTIIQAGADENIQCRWDLYSKFLEYVLYKHSSNIQKVGHDQWAQDIQAALGAVSYEAIDQDEAVWTIIPLGIISTTLDNIGISQRMIIDDLPSVGVGDLLDVSDSTDGPSLVFTHQSFQEFLAADWASRDETRITHILEECWNSKWKETIRFLAGRNEGHSVVDALIHSHRDNIIHSRLFFAAQCARETGKEADDLKAELTERLLPLLDTSMRRPAVRSLLWLGSPASLSRAWEHVCRKELPIISSGVLDPMDDPWNAVITQTLYSEDRLAHIVQRLKQPDPEWAAEMLDLWPWAIDDDLLENLITRASSSSGQSAYGAQEALVTLSEHLDSKHVSRIIDLLKSGDRVCRIYLAYILGSLKPRVWKKVQFSQLELLQDDDLCGFISARSLCERAPELSPDHITWILTRLFREQEDREDTSNLEAAAGYLREEFNEDHLRSIRSMLFSSSERKQRIALGLLAETRPRLEGQEARQLIRLLKVNRLRPHAIMAIVAMTDQFPKRLMCEILNLVFVDEHETKAAVFDSFHLLKELVRPEHSEEVMQILEEVSGRLRQRQSNDNDEENDRILQLSCFWACAAIGDRLDVIATQRIISCLGNFGEEYVVSEHWPMVCKRLALSLNDTSYREVVRMYFSRERSDVQDALLDLLLPERLTQADAHMLVRTFQECDSTETFRIYNRLCQLYQRGLLENTE